MPKQTDLRLEQHIQELRARGMGVRAIGRELSVAPSTISRYLRREVNRQLLRDLTQRLDLVEAGLRVAHGALADIAYCIVSQGQPTMGAKQRLAEAMRCWPPDLRRS